MCVDLFCKVLFVVVCFSLTKEDCMNVSLTSRPSALIPIAMSLAALGTVLYHIARFGIAPEPDEGAAAHIWQLLMAGQVPVVVFYAVKWLPRAPRTALPVLAVQIGAALAALAPVYLLGW
jgi:hypothetical protein